MKIQNSVIVKISAAYIFLAIVNVIFISSLILENQVDIIVDNKILNLEKKMTIFMRSLKKINSKKTPQKRSGFADTYIENIETLLKSFKEDYCIYEEDGKIIKKSDNIILLPKDFKQNTSRSLTKKAFNGAQYHSVIDENKKILYFYIPISDMVEKRIFLIIRNDISSVGTHFNNLYRQILIMICGIIIMHILFGFISYYLLVKPLIILRGKSLAMSKGDFSVRLSSQRKDEYGAIAESFNDMAVAVEATVNELNNKKLTFEKQNIDLLNLKDMAESASEAKSDFLAHINHEIRTPLNNIHGYLELLEDSNLTILQEKYITIIKNNARSLLSLINDVLDFSKIESGKMDIDNIQFNSEDEFFSVIEMFQMKALEKEIDLVSFISPLLSKYLWGDPLRIKQILINLIGNAIKFTPEKGTIFVAISPVERTDEYEVNFSVSDTGIGISEYKQDIIFDSFQQEHSSITGKYGGTGLGLSICKNLVSIMGGKFNLESTQGQGSHFSFSLIFQNNSEENIIQSLDEKLLTQNISFIEGPDDFIKSNKIIEWYLKDLGFKSIKKITKESNFDETILDGIFISYNDLYSYNIFEKLEVNETVKKILLISELNSLDIIYKNISFNEIVSTPFNSSLFFNCLKKLSCNRELDNSLEKTEKKNKVIFKGNVLIAEDNPDSRELVEILFEDMGLNVDSAVNGLEAIDKFKMKSYDIIFLDINMPVYDGIEVADFIIENETERGLKHTPVVALTARSIKGDRQMFLSRGFDEYIVKPLDKDKIIEALEHFLPENSIQVSESFIEKDKVDDDIFEKYSLRSIATEIGISFEKLVPILEKAFLMHSEIFPKLKDAIEEKDMDNIYFYSHKLKGSFLFLHFNPLINIIEAIEDDFENVNQEKNFERYNLLYERWVYFKDKITKE